MKKKVITKKERTTSELKDNIVLYLEKKAQSTKDRHVNEIIQALDAEKAYILDIINELVQENKIKKEFTLFGDYYILTKDYKVEMTRKYLEIQNYFKIRADDPYCFTQASVTLEFELPFSIVGVILNDMTNNKLIKKETAEITKDGKARKIRYYIPQIF